jgi:hypothetical protein
MLLTMEEAIYRLPRLAIPRKECLTIPSITSHPKHSTTPQQYITTLPSDIHSDYHLDLTV